MTLSLSSLAIRAGLDNRRFPDCWRRRVSRGRFDSAQMRSGRLAKFHSDIERGFIRAEVVAFDDLMACGSEAKCREQGKLRLEGKEYTVADGNIINFRFNV